MLPEIINYGINFSKFNNRYLTDIFPLTFILFNVALVFNEHNLIDR